MCAFLLLVIRLLILFLVATHQLVPQTVHIRAVRFCEVYGRSIDCPAWVQGSMTTAGHLANECHTAYPPGQEVQFQLCLEEYGF